MSLPSVEVVRNRIETKVGDKPFEHALKAIYLFDARLSEVITKIYPSDLAAGKHVYGVKLRVEQQEHLGHPISVFTVATAKRDGLERYIALPQSEQYEPWTREVTSWIEQEDPPFPFYDQDIQTYVKDNSVFEGLSYPIARYDIWEGKVLTKTVEAHVKPFRTHALRHLRTTELAEFYGFDPLEIAIFGGWSWVTVTKLMSQTPQFFGAGGGALIGAMQRYTHLQWEKYFPKLLKKR